MAAVDERIQAAQDFLEAADREFAVGDNRQGSEKLWGAATQLMIAMAEERGWESGSHRAMKNAAERLAVEFDDDRIGFGFGVAESFHRNFHHNFMEDFELAVERPKARAFVERILNCYDRP